MLKKYIITLLLIIGYNNMLFSNWKETIEQIFKNLSLSSGLTTTSQVMQLMSMIPWGKKYFADDIAKMNMKSMKMQRRYTNLQYYVTLNSLYPSTSTTCSFSKFSPIAKCTWYQLGELEAKNKNIFHY